MEDWRRMKMAGSSSGFSEFMNNDEIINPPGVALVLERMYADQASLRAKQVDRGRGRGCHTTLVSRPVRFILY